MNTGEHVEERPLGRRRETDAVGGHRRHAERRREADERIVVALFLAAIVALQLDVDAIAPEDADEAIEQPADAVPPAVERAAPGERDEAAAAAVELFERQRTFALWRAHFHARHQPAKVAVAVRAFAEDGQQEGRIGRVGLVGRMGRACLVGLGRVG